MAEVRRLITEIRIKVNLNDVLSESVAQKKRDDPFITPATDPVAVSVASSIPNSVP
jgi:hypothetical protein